MDRKHPFYMDSLTKALAWAKKHERAIWTLIKGQKGVFHVYPGGRIIQRPHQHLGREL